MNLLDEFRRAMSLDEYVGRLEDEKEIYHLHYRKAEAEPYRIEALPPLKLLVISEIRCGDSTAMVPVLVKYLEREDVEIRIALRSENPELMERFLTNGAKAIPVFLILDDAGNLLSRFGPRPKPAQEIFETYRRDIYEGRIERKEVSKKIRTFYAKDRGTSILREFSHILRETLITT